MAAQSQSRLTPEEYLAVEREAEHRNEYYNGFVYPVSRSTYEHVVITGNLAFALRSSLGKSGTVATSDLRVRASAEGLYTYPDLVVVCGEPKFADELRDTLLNPIVVVEVFSPATEARDRGFRFARYRTIESLQEYVLVSQTEARVETFLRQAEGTWLLTETTGLEATCRVESIACTLQLRDVYEKVAFDEDAAAG
jgi:Uma2 family endonuclease